MPNRQTLTPERLAHLLTKLDEVLSEAARLRREITRQLNEHHDTVQQRVTPLRKASKHR